MVKFKSSYMLFTETYSNILYPQNVWIFFIALHDTWPSPQIFFYCLSIPVRMTEDGTENESWERWVTKQLKYWTQKFQQLSLTNDVDSYTQKSRRWPCTWCHHFLTNCAYCHVDNYDFIESVVRCALRDDTWFKQENDPEKICWKCHVSFEQWMSKNTSTGCGISS